MRSEYNDYVQNVFSSTIAMHIATLVLCWVTSLGYYFLLLRPYMVRVCVCVLGGLLFW
jgi:hypothetical protein